MTRPILIAGPTASGKSAAALALARRIGGAVVNADSMQVYRELSILTARPPAEDLAQAPHRLYGHVPAAEPYSVVRWLSDVTAELDGLRREGLVPIIAGGTGLYFEALLKGLSPVPEIPADARAHWRAEADRLAPEQLHEALAARDPIMAARLRPSDPQRVTRALEVLDATGRSLADWQSVPGTPLLRAEACARYVLSPEREVLYERCNSRFDAMMAGGVLTEVEKLLALGLPASMPVMRATGVRPLAEHLAGRLSREEAIEQAKAETRQYAKRQSTWIRGRMADWTPVPQGADIP